MDECLAAKPYHSLRSTKNLSKQAPKSFFFFFPLFFRATPVAMEVPRLRVKSELSIAADLCHSHSNTGSKPSLWPTPQLSSRRRQILTHWVRPGIEPATSWFLVGFLSDAPWTPPSPALFFLKDNLGPKKSTCRNSYWHESKTTLLWQHQYQGAKKAKK